MDQLFENFFEHSPAATAQGGMHVPPVEVAESNDTVMVKVQVPGVAKDKLQISIENDTLTLHGERQEEKKHEGQQYSRREFHYGAFARTIPLPTGVIEDQATARLQDGVLTITVPKGQQARSKRITIESASEGSNGAAASRLEQGQPQASHAQAQAGQAQARSEPGQPKANNAQA